MDHFQHRGGQLYCEEVNLDDLADRLGTPLYVYSQHTLLDHYQRFSAAFAPLDPLICFALKSCHNIHVIRTLAEQGAGADVVSGGELYRAQAAGVDPSRVVAAGVGKTDTELKAILKAQVGWLNVESEQEFEVASALARELGQRQRVALRINPDVRDQKTPEKTTTGKKGSKFGVDIDRAVQFFDQYGKDPSLQLRGLHCHIGSPIFSPEPYKAAIERLLALITELRAKGHTISSLDIGGGFAANYDGNFAAGGGAPTWQQYADVIVPLLSGFVKDGGQVILEPGRTLTANSGVLLTRVQYLKQGGGRQFAVVDAGMSQHMRPAMYDAYHFIWPTRVREDQVPTGYAPQQAAPDQQVYDVAGPICESSDFLARERSLPKLERGRLLCMYSSGAYGMSMASQYNSLPRAAEVMVDGTRARVIRKRETYDDLIALELSPSIVPGFE